MTRFLLGISVAAAAGLWCAAAEDVSLSVLDVPYLEKAPAVDGVMSPGEWDRAAAIAGVTNQADNVLFPRPTTFYLGWDGQRIYLACRVWMMPGYKPRVGGREPLSASVGDDGLELHFQPLGKNLPAGQSTTSSYKFFVNALGFCGEPIRVSVGQLFRNWLPAFRSAAGTGEPGRAPAGGRWLVIEWAGSVDDFELAGENQAGDEWRMMLGINHIPIWLQARIPASSGYFDPSGYTRIRLVRGRPVARMTMDKLPGLADGRAAVSVSVVNPGPKPATVNVEVRCFVTDRDREEVLAERRQTLSPDAAGTAELELDEALAKALDKRTATFLVQATSGPDTLLRYKSLVRAYPENWTQYTPSKDPFPFSVAFNPVRSNFSISADRYYLDEPESAVALEYVLKEERTGKAVTRGRIDAARLDCFSRFVQLEPLATGPYVVEGALVLRDGKRLGPMERSCQKLDEGKEFPEWWQTKLGSIERVIPPFTPMRSQADRVEMWGRRYDLGLVGLPDRVESQGVELLAAPARLVAVVRGREEIIDLAGRPSICEKTPWRVRWKGKVTDAGLRITATGWVEQDGLCYVELTYGPGGSGPATLDALRIEWPFRAEVAECLLCYGPGGNFSSRTAIVLPPKQGRLWSTLDLGHMGSGMSVGSLYPLVWLGNEQRGLLWWADSDRGWVPDNDVPAHEVVRQGDQVILRNHLIGKRVELTEARTIALSYMASPFRPLVRNWREAVYSADGTFSGGAEWEGIGYKARKDPESGQVFDGWNLLTPPSPKLEQWGSLWAQYKEKADAKLRREQWRDPGAARNWMFIHTSLPLTGYGWKSPDPRVISYFAPEWGGREAYVPSNIDYYLYLADRAFREGGLRTIYWDIFFPCEHHTVQNGMAYLLPDGRVQPGYAGWNTRRFLMRLYALMYEHGLTPGGQVAHATNAYLLVATPWVDAILDGEFHKLTDQSTMDWVDGYPVEHMRAMANCHNWGTVISWMNHIEVTGEKGARVRRGFVDYIRLFDAWRGPNHGSLPEDLLEWGMTDERVEYVPFWRNPYVGTEDPDVFVSLWRLPDRILLSVFNHDRAKPKNVPLHVDLDRLGLVPQLPWQEFLRVRALAEELPRNPPPSLDFHQRQLTVPALAPRTARLISIRKY